MVPRLTVLTLLLLVTCATNAYAQQEYRPQVLVVGDSLAVGMRPFLGTLLPTSDIYFDVKSGRTTPVGLQQLRLRLRSRRPDVVVVSLGTNDGWNPLRFADRINRALAAIPRTSCIVWSSIDRPPRKGPFKALNKVLWAASRRDRRLKVVDWHAAVISGQVTLPDGLHPDQAGYEFRSRMIAGAIERAC